jgi:hypothetical protein
LPDPLCSFPLEKRGPAFRKDLPPSLVERLITWFQENYEHGIHGPPCAPMPEWSPAISPARISLRRIGRCRPLPVLKADRRC